MNAVKKGRRPRGGKKAAPRRLRTLLWLALPTLLLLPLVWISTVWHLRTRVQLEFETARLAFTLGGEEYREILNRSVPFASLVIEDCSTVEFAAEKLEIADPQQLVPGTEAGEMPHFPATAWREIKPTGPVKLSCRDPAAKLTLQHPDPTAARLGLLDNVRFAPGSEVILAISPGQEPAVSLEIETPQKLDILFGRDLELVTEFIEPNGIAVPFSGDLLAWRARFPAERRTLEMTSGEHGLVLIVTPARGQASELFPKKPSLPLASVELLEEDLEGTLFSPLSAKASLSYPDYPAAPAVTIEKDEVVGLSELSKAQLRSLNFDAEKSALCASFDGIVGRATSRAGEFARDHRLTLYDRVRYDFRLQLVAMAAVSIFSATWGAFGAWKKLQEYSANDAEPPEEVSESEANQRAAKERADVTEPPVEVSGSGSTKK